MDSRQYYAWWQREDLCYQGGQLHFAGRAVKQLAAQFGSRSFVYSFARVRQNLDRLHQALAEAELQAGFTVLYAMKANRFVPLLTRLQETGRCGIDACSPNEVELAVSCDFSPSDISFTAGNLSRADYEQLARYEGLFMDCDSLHAIRTWAQYKPGAKIGIRINPAAGVSREANSALQYAGKTVTKFGIYQEQFDEALTTVADCGLTVTKIHFHTGCGYLTPQLNQLDEVIERCMWFIKRCDKLEKVNMGGGLGVPHNVFDQPLDLTQWAAVLKKHFSKTGLHLEVEPGEYLLKDAGILLLEKTMVEQKKDIVFLGLDAGFNLAPEPAYYQLPLQPVPLDLRDEVFSPMRVVGNINEAIDVWYDQSWMPDMDGQEYLALINAGAYSSSMASNHCMRGQFKEFLLP
ncbi:MAG: diaminopimelate decarboxylase [Candidatus Electrothrix aestuarii]|uniref:Diaminopimelate decarboxylase n=1 Tax=Candidatus Electrothrix aestuarii TaxID=3062594 RepID=A0AAU8LTB3_9BACT|nr:diaminopimelate decarboxylase [Candidatus Electrothrix aestuarii]